MKFRAVQMKGKDLKPGDIFITTSELDWEMFIERSMNCVGYKVYLRTECPHDPSEDDSLVCKIIIE